MEALRKAVDRIAADKSTHGLPRAHLSFLALVAAYKLDRTLALSHESAGAAATSVTQFLASGSASDKAVRLQAAFYSAYTAARRALTQRGTDRNRRMDGAEAAIQAVAEGVTPGMSAADLTKLNGVYKHIIDYCTASCSADAALCGSKPSRVMDVLEYITAVQREFATALESVLPKTGVQDFLRTPREERASQMDELARLVAGIRLFNWEAGKGGPGLEHTPSLAAQEGRALAADVASALQSCLTLCKQYMEVLGAVQAGGLQASAEDIAKWTAELANRRAACVLLAALHEDATTVAARVESALSSYSAEVADLKRTIGGQAAVSKDAVYPRFSGMARAWLEAAEGRLEVTELRGVVESIRAYTPGGTVSTLPFTTVVEAQRVTAAAAAGGAAHAQAVFAPAGAPAAEGEPAERVDPRAVSELQQDGPVALELAGMCPVSLCTPVAGARADARLGVLQPGDLSHGLYRYHGRLFAVSSEAAGAAFAAAPGRYLSTLGSLACDHPELVHVLELLAGTGPLAAHGASFPVASLPVLCSFDGDLHGTAAAVAEQAGLDAAAAAAEAAGGAAGADMTVGAGATMPAGTQTSSLGASTGNLSSTTRLGATGRVSKKTGAALVDVGVETPVHFVERHIDPHYRFSEWALRRQAIRIANIRKCATHGVQTDSSAFKRDNDTQVYLPRETGTQTGISVAVNTDREVRYVGGLRGYAEPFVEQAAANIAAGKPALGDTGSKTEPVPGPTHAMRITTATLAV